MSGADGRADRVRRARALTPAERVEILETFFRAHPGAGRGRTGLGRALVDFTRWQVDSGRVPRSAWWSAVNGWMVLDLAETTPAWRRYAAADAQESQARLWEAHQRSLGEAREVARHLLDREPAAERDLVDLVLRIVDRAAAAGVPTDGDTLDRQTRRHYPAHYPAAASDLVVARGDRAASRQSGSR